MELPTPGLKFTFIERIEDITDIVNAKIAAKEITETESFSGAFLQRFWPEELYAKSDLKDKKGNRATGTPTRRPEVKLYRFLIRKYTRMCVWWQLLLLLSVSLAEKQRTWDVAPSYR